MGRGVGSQVYAVTARLRETVVGKLVVPPKVSVSTHRQPATHFNRTFQGFTSQKVHSVADILGEVCFKRRGEKRSVGVRFPNGFTSRDD